MLRAAGGRLARVQSDAEAAADGQHGAGDVGCRWRAQECDQRGDFLGRAGARDGGVGEDAALVDRLDVLGDALGRDQARLDHIGGDAVVRALGGEALDEASEPGLGRRVGDLPVGAVGRGDRAERDDAPEATLLHARDQRGSELERRAQVDVEHALELGVVDALERRIGRKGRGVVHEHVDRGHAAREPLEERALAQVAGEGERGELARAQVLERLRERLVAARRDHHLRSELAQGERHRAADPARGSRHDRGATRQHALSHLTHFP